ncbi:MAG: hypothetical protein JXL81_03745 [Deltaproteobacteria bacterium]|nr:hypothetical protein [Deltaproteobacteria bacterium]
MGFIRDKEEKITVQFLTWKYQKLNRAVPPESELREQASRIVEDAHRIARERGSNVLSILKELAGNYINKTKG